MKEIEYMKMIKRNQDSCIFTISDLTDWIIKEEDIGYRAARYKANRLIKKLPLEALSLTMYKLTVIPEGVESLKKKGEEKSTEILLSERPSDVIDYLNNQLGTKYKGKPSDMSRIKARMSPPESYKLDDFKLVIDKKIKDWKGTHMQKYLRPETLFGTKFESYLNEDSTIKEGKASEMANYSFEKYIP